MKTQTKNTLLAPLRKGLKETRLDPPPPPQPIRPPTQNHPISIGLIDISKRKKKQSKDKKETAKGKRKRPSLNGSFREMSDLSTSLITFDTPPRTSSLLPIFSPSPSPLPQSRSPTFDSLNTFF